MRLRLTKKTAEPAPRRRHVNTDRSRMTPFGYYSGTAHTQRSRAEQLERSKTVRNAPIARHWTGEALRLVKTRFGVILVALALLIFGFNMIRLSSDVAVESLNAPGTGYVMHDQQTYQAAAQDYFNESLFNKNKLTVNTAAVERQMLQQFPELISASVAVPLVSHRPVIYLRAAEPSFILLTDADQSYVVDDTGRAMARTAEIHALDELHLPVVQDESGLRVSRGTVVLSSTSSLFVREVVHQFSAKKITLSRLRLPAASSELDVYPNGHNYFIKFNLQNDTAVQQVGTYFAVISKLRQQGITPKHYVDVRIDGRAYYK